MAIDSAEKRKAISGIFMPFGPGVTPNVLKDAEWRGEVGFGYPFLSGVTPPATPANFSVTAGDAQVTLSWQASAGATSYNIYRGLTSGGEVLVQSGIAATSFVDTGLTNGTTYYYQVSAVNAGGESARTAEDSATPQAAPVPVPPAVGPGTGGGLGQAVPSYHTLFPPPIERGPRRWIEPKKEPERRRDRERLKKREKKKKPVLVELKTGPGPVPGPGPISDDAFFELLLINDFDFITAAMLVDAGVR